MPEFHTKFMEVYPHCAKPKLHLMRHITQGVKHHQLNMACMAGERFHRRTNEFGRVAYLQFQDTMFMRTIKHQLDTLKEPHQQFQCMLLKGKQMSLAVNGVPVMAWTRAKVGRVRMDAGNVAYWTMGHHVCFGRARGIVESDGVAYLSANTMIAVGNGLLAMGPMTVLSRALVCVAPSCTWRAQDMCVC